MDQVVVQPEDLKYLSNDPNFNPNRNKAIINETIKETEKFFSELSQLKDEEAGNRIDILSSYARYRFNVGTKKIKDYLGRELYNKVVGEKVLSKVRTMDTVNRLSNNNKFKNSILI